MKKYIMSRATGKTTLLIHQSAETKAPILCATTTTADEIRRKADKLGLEIPAPISVTNIENSLRGKDVGNVLVDDADCVLNVLLYDAYGVVTQAMTISP